MFIVFKLLTGTEWEYLWFWQSTSWKFCLRCVGYLRSRRWSGGVNELNCDHVAKSQKEIMCEAETLYQLLQRPWHNFVKFFFFLVYGTFTECVIIWWMTQLWYQESVMLSYSDNNAQYKVKCLAMSAEHDIIPTACGKILLLSDLHPPFWLLPCEKKYIFRRLENVLQENTIFLPHI